MINKVANSGIITLNLENFYPDGERIEFDLKDYLFQGFVLREKDFRAELKAIDWKKYQNKFVAVHCSADAIVPTWAYMLVSSYLQPFASEIIFGNLENLETFLFEKKLAEMDFSEYQDKRMVIKGCGDLKITDAAYLKITALLMPFAKSIMYGEPCSTVPIFKRKT